MSVCQYRLAEGGCEDCEECLDKIECGMYLRVTRLTAELAKAKKGIPTKQEMSVPIYSGLDEVVLGLALTLEFNYGEDGYRLAQEIKKMFWTRRKKEAVEGRKEER